MSIFYENNFSGGDTGGGVPEDGTGGGQQLGPDKP